MHGDVMAAFYDDIRKTAANNPNNALGKIDGSEKISQQALSEHFNALMQKCQKIDCFLKQSIF
jgi:hypothetical protein